MQLLMFQLSMFYFGTIAGLCVFSLQFVMYAIAINCSGTHL